MSDERINNNATDSNDEVLQWVTYRLGEETYGINVMQVQEVLRYTEIAPVPVHLTMYLVLSICVVT